MSNIDLIGDFVEGELSPQEVARLKQTLRRDDELARFADEYEWVHRLTGLSRGSSALPEPVPAAPQNTLLRRAAGLAFSFAVGACAVFFLTREPARTSPARVQLDQISLAPISANNAYLGLPPSLSSYHSVERGIVRFAGSMDEARAIARVSERSVLVLYGTPNCPYCYRIKATTLVRPEAIEVMTKLVIVEANLYDLPEDEQAQWLSEGYPWLEVQDTDGTPLHRFSGAAVAAEFIAELQKGFQARPTSAQPPDWSRVQALARDHNRARAFELERRFADASRAFDELAKAELSAFAAAGHAGLERIASEARAQLLDAWSLSLSSPADALALLDQAHGDFAGTPYAPDIGRVRNELGATAKFPRLVPPSAEDRGTRGGAETGG